MNRYDRVKRLVRDAPKAIESGYRGYTDALALALYLDDTHGVNVNCDEEAQRAFKAVYEAERTFGLTLHNRVCGCQTLH